MPCSLQTTEPSPGDSLVDLLRKLIQALGETWDCGDREWQLVATLVTHFGGSPAQGDSLMVLWQKLRIALGDTDCHCGDEIWDAMRRVLAQMDGDAFRNGDSRYQLLWRMLESV